MSTAFLSDIPAQLARDAYSGTSFTPERRGESAREDYARTLASDHASLTELAARNGTADLLEGEFNRYREGYAKRYRAYLASNARCLSWMITGPANFPSARNEKRNNIAHKRLTELVEFRERALSAIRKVLCPAARPIMSGDEDAVERLQAKLAEAEEMQARMKAANAVVRKHFKDKVAGVAALVAMGFSEENAAKLFEPDCCGRYGFPDYALTNNNANIRRLKGRIAEVSRTKAVVGFEVEGENARLEDCPAENRVRLYYSGKPSEEVRTRLKRMGFRWTPSLECWQAYRHQHTYDFARQETGVSEEVLREAVLAVRAGVGREEASV